MDEEYDILYLSVENGGVVYGRGYMVSDCGGNDNS